ncbi:AAA domain, putative AbiEii toxin, Type IV TA system [compost metagenome]
MKTVVRTDERILSSDIFDRDSRVKRPDHGSWAEPGKNIPVYHRCGVLVVGGGPSGTAAAAAAARAGADVALLERKGAAAWYRDDEGNRRQLEEPLLAGETALAAVRGTVPELDAVRHTLSSWRFYHGFRTDADAPLRRPAMAITAPMLDADGGNLAAVFATLAHIRQDTTDLHAAIEHAFPGARLEIPPPTTSASFTMSFPDMPKRQFGANELSDGTLQFLALMGALLAYRLPPLIALNEPEASLHPQLLPALARIIARAAERSQVWVVTHSQVLADALAEETGVVPRTVVRRDGGTWLDGLSRFGGFEDD